MQKTLIVRLFLALYLVFATCQIEAMLQPYMPHPAVANSTFVVHRRGHVHDNTRKEGTPCLVQKFVEFPELALKALLSQTIKPDTLSLIIKYLEATHGDQYTANILEQKIVAGNAQHVDMLIDAGVNPHALLVPRDGSMSIHRALRSFLSDDSQDTTNQRLAILRRLLGQLDPKHKPAAFEIDLCLIPKKVRPQVAQLLNRQHIPKRLCMVDDPCQIIGVHDSSVGIADVNLSDDEEISATNWNPLHKAVLSGDYTQCTALLTRFHTPVFIANEKFPLSALISISKPHEKGSDKKFDEALITIKTFTAKMRSIIDQQVTLANTLRAAQDHQGLTAFEVARKNNAPEDVLRLLDPNDGQVIKQLIKKKITALFLNNLDLDDAQAADQLQETPLQLDDIAALLEDKEYEPKPAAKASTPADKTATSPLHEAVLKGDYAQCNALLTTFKEPILHDEIFPMEALLKTQIARHEVSDREYQEAAAIMNTFDKKTFQKIDQQFKLSDKLRTARDHAGRTAYDIARAAHAPTEIITLLDPNNNETIKKILAEKLKTIFINNLEKAQAQQKAQAQRTQLQKITEQLINKELKVGDKVIINGREYTVTDAQKSK